MLGGNKRSPSIKDLATPRTTLRGILIELLYHSPWLSGVHCCVSLTPPSQTPSTVLSFFQAAFLSKKPYAPTHDSMSSRFSFLRHPSELFSQLFPVILDELLQAPSTWICILISFRYPRFRWSKPTVYLRASHCRGIVELFATAGFLDPLVHTANGTMKYRTRKELQRVRGM
jgi:hypothetical protein